MLSIRRLEDCASVFCASRMHTAEVPRSAWQISTRSSPKKCDFPDPRPPCTALYLAGASSGSNIFAVGIFRMDNDALDFVDQFKVFSDKIATPGDGVIIFRGLQSYTFKAVITIIVTGFVGAVWLGVKAMLGK